MFTKIGEIFIVVWYNNHFTGLDRSLGLREVEASGNSRQ